MPTYKLRRFSQLDVLKRVNPENLLEFLIPFREFLAQQGLKLPSRRSTTIRWDYDQLIGILLAPAGELPEDLVEALYFVDDLSTPGGQELLIQCVPGLDYVWRDSPADIAVKAWVLDPELVEQLHAEQRVTKRARLYESYLASQEAFQNREVPNREIVAAIERELEAWFLSRKRGRGTRVFPSLRGEGFGFLVRHGEAYRREGAMKKGRSASIVYRPEKHDILEFDPHFGEVRVHAKSPKDKTIYRDVFARYLLKPGESFQKKAKYILEPLKKYGRLALACHDVPGLAWVKLVSIEWHDNQFPRGYERTRAYDVFEKFEIDGRVIPSHAEIISAKFEIRLNDIRHPRRVTIEPPNILRLTRDEDGMLVERWLYLRGFINWEGKDNTDEDSSFLESA